MQSYAKHIGSSLWRYFLYLLKSGKDEDNVYLREMFSRFKKSMKMDRKHAIQTHSKALQQTNKQTHNKTID
jgi:thioesterase domain-containing protein